MAGAAGDAFYDDVADLYHLVYEDWERSVRGQASALDAVFTRAVGPGAKRILDVSCGIGTQCLGLAALGHSVVGRDLSAGAVARARREAAARGLAMEFAVGDMRQPVAGGGFDVVMSADNSLPHLLTDGDIRMALAAMRDGVRPGGAVVVTLRDYAAEPRTSPQVRPYGVRKAGDDRYIVFQVWEFDRDGARYDVAMYFVREGIDRAPEVRVARARYYAIEVARVADAMREVGLEAVGRCDGDYFQPVLMGRRPA